MKIDELFLRLSTLVEVGHCNSNGMDIVKYSVLDREYREALTAGKRSMKTYPTRSQSQDGDF